MSLNSLKKIVWPNDRVKDLAFPSVKAFNEINAGAYNTAGKLTTDYRIKYFDNSETMLIEFQPTRQTKEWFTVNLRFFARKKKSPHGGYMLHGGFSDAYAEVEEIIEREVLFNIARRLLRFARST
jgi:hypothetical protein